jgi:hypothetical protein
VKRRNLLLLCTTLPIVAGLRALHAQTGKPAFKPEELDQMLAPVALYPDSLLSQVLMAAGYPLEIVEAARWLKANPTLKGDAAVTAVKDKDWDTSVKSLVAFPDVLSQMNEHLDWTQKMGDAMIGQEQDVADSIQRLRAKAQAAGNLQSTPQQTVTTQGSGDNVQYVIAPTDPQVVYVPSYDPSWAYGSWPYSAYPPTYYPLAGALTRGFFWGVGFAAGNALYGGWNWAGHGNSYANVNVNRAVNIDNNFNRTNINTNGQWQHNAAHRKGVGYRDPAVANRYNQVRPGADQRAQFRGRPEGNAAPANSPQVANRTPGAGGGPGAAGARPNVPQQQVTNRTPGAAGGPGASGARPNVPQQQVANRTNQPPSAFSGVNSGQQVNREAQRGQQQMNRAQSHPMNQAPSGGGAAAGGRGGGGRR